MNGKLAARLQKEIRRHAFQHADVLRQERQLAEKTRHTLDALQEVTGLPRSELESIADAVKLSLQGSDDEFFSIKRQILLTAGLFSFTLILCGLSIIII